MSWRCIGASRFACAIGALRLLPMDNEDIKQVLQELNGTHMPFGKFGPEKFPPYGLPICDLPYEYLAYFERKGYPRGRLGELMKIAHDIKRDGADSIFDPFRALRGGRSSLRGKRRLRSFRVNDPE
jgi:uncharacterized protein (DUF3820 family)